jgi:hypothetical protein
VAAAFALAVAVGAVFGCAARAPRHRLDPVTALAGR